MAEYNLIFTKDELTNRIQNEIQRAFANQREEIKALEALIDKISKTTTEKGEKGAPGPPGKDAAPGLTRQQILSLINSQFEGIRKVKRLPLTFEDIVVFLTEPELTNRLYSSGLSPLQVSDLLTDDQYQRYGFPIGKERLIYAHDEEGESLELKLEGFASHSESRPPRLFVEGLVGNPRKTTHSAHHRALIGACLSANCLIFGDNEEAFNQKENIVIIGVTRQVQGSESDDFESENICGYDTVAAAGANINLQAEEMVVRIGTRFPFVVYWNGSGWRILRWGVEIDSRFVSKDIGLYVVNKAKNDWEPLILRGQSVSS